MAILPNLLARMDGKIIGMIRVKNRIETLELPREKKTKTQKIDTRRNIDIENWGKVNALLTKGKKKRIQRCKIFIDVNNFCVCETSLILFLKCKDNISAFPFLSFEYHIVVYNIV